MEASGKWPNDIVAFRKTKTAFYIELSEQLNKQSGLMSKVHYDYLDVWHENLSFRIHLACNKELVLLRQKVNKKGEIEHVDCKDADMLERFIIHLPIISSAINGVNTKFSAFSSTSRLVKRWLSSHLLLDHINEVALELIVAYLFLNPSPYTIPL